MVFKSKIAWWFYVLEVLLGGLTALMIILAIMEQEVVLYIAVALFVLIMGLLMVPMLVNTKYVLDETQLQVVCGLSAKHLPYSCILNVKPNFDPSSSPALSLDRIQVQYRNKDGINNFVSISPKDKTHFMEELNHRIANNSQCTFEELRRTSYYSHNR